MNQERDLADSLRPSESVWRVCAFCLREVPRDEHAEHMKAHGYEVLELLFSGEDGYTKKE